MSSMFFNACSSVKRVDPCETNASPGNEEGERFKARKSWIWAEQCAQSEKIVAQSNFEDGPGRGR